MPLVQHALTLPPSLLPHRTQSDTRTLQYRVNPPTHVVNASEVVAVPAVNVDVTTSRIAATPTTRVVDDATSESVARRAAPSQPKRDARPHTHAFTRHDALPNGTYDEGFVCDRCGVEVESLSTAHPVFFHCACGEDLCFACGDTALRCGICRRLYTQERDKLAHVMHRHAAEMSEAAKAEAHRTSFASHYELLGESCSPGAAPTAVVYAMASDGVVGATHLPTGSVVLLHIATGTSFAHGDDAIVQRLRDAVAAVGPQLVPSQTAPAAYPSLIPQPSDLAYVTKVVHDVLPSEDGVDRHLVCLFYSNRTAQIFAHDNTYEMRFSAKKGAEGVIRRRADAPGWADGCWDDKAMLTPAWTFLMPGYTVPHGMASMCKVLAGTRPDEVRTPFPATSSQTTDDEVDSIML